MIDNEQWESLTTIEYILIVSSSYFRRSSTSFNQTKEQINMKRFVDQTSHEINDKDDFDFLFSI